MKSKTGFTSSGGPGRPTRWSKAYPVLTFRGGRVVLTVHAGSLRPGDARRGGQNYREVPGDRPGGETAERHALSESTGRGD